MQMALNVLLCVELALLFVHEMDAAHRQEWKMFVVLKDMEDERAFRVFTLLHIPLYAIVLILLFSPYFLAGNYVVDIFLVLHALIHLVFRKHPANKLNGRLSRVILYLAGALAAVHLVVLTVWHAV